MTSLYCCPSCHGEHLIEIRDYERNLRIIKCDTCGEMYAITEEDIYNIGVEQIFMEWHKGYTSQRRLEAGDD